LQIPAPHGVLEAHFRPAEAPLRGSAVLCHPHPLHGGTLHTKAVFRAAQALNEAGFHVLRFNFRGVGTSTGVHDHGIGEQDDARAAVDWLQDQYPDLPILLGGFSFGSIVALRVGEADPRVQALLALGLPVSLRDLEHLGHEATRGTRPLLMVQGEEDEFGDGATLAAHADKLGAGVHVVRIPQSGHFFHDHMDQLKVAIRDFFSGPVGGAPFPVRAPVKAPMKAPMKAPVLAPAEAAVKPSPPHTPAGA